MTKNADCFDRDDPDIYGGPVPAFFQAAGNSIFATPHLRIPNQIKFVSGLRMSEIFSLRFLARFLRIFAPAKKMQTGVPLSNPARSAAGFANPPDSRRTRPPAGGANSFFLETGSRVSIGSS